MDDGKDEQSVQEKMQDKAEEVRQQFEDAVGRLRKQVKKEGDALPTRLKDGIQSAIKGDGRDRRFGRPPTGRPPSGRPPSRGPRSET